MLELNTPAVNLRMVGPIYSARLRKLEIVTIEDLLFHLPSRYDDFSSISKINNLQIGDKTTVIGEITSFENIFTKYGKKIQKALLTDDTGTVEIIWYNQTFLKNILVLGTNIAICGDVKIFGSKLVFESPDYEIIKHSQDSQQSQSNHLVHSGRLVPIYPETAGISSKWLRSRIYSLLFKFLPDIQEYLPPSVLRDHNLINRKKAVYQVHFPNNPREAENARRRLAFDELLSFQLLSNIRKQKWQNLKVKFRLSISDYLPQIRMFIDKLPFNLTLGQEKALNEILIDLERDKPMNRLLEGDVGSGKTVVAAISMFAVHLNKLQSVFMAPTEILARQHYDTINALLKPYKINIKFLSGSSKYKDELINSKFDVLVGTHALLSDKLKLKKLGLIIIDEQQRFGVEQRARLRGKGINPHVLTLTATPIPRTIALTLYADLDLSVIGELPIGRRMIKTWVVPREKRKAAYKWIQKQIEESNPRNQAFIICPLIDESENLSSVKASKAEYSKLKKEIFPNLRLGLLHGQLKPNEKDKVMKNMKENKYDILVATPVVEVGIDIPTATIIMIEGAERFGLSQLHQLRGRVGRNNTQSYCLLFTETENTEIISRLKILETNFSGPRIAELDLKLRGAGELYGVRQHGNLGPKIADISDLPLISETKKALNYILLHEPAFLQHSLLKEKVQKYKIESIAPD